MPMQEYERPTEDMEPPAPEPEPPVPTDVSGVSEGPVPDYYAVLGVPPGAGRRTVAEAYDRLARLLQPDENAPPTDPDRMRQVDEAFDVLDDPKRRAEYDRARGIKALPHAPRGILADKGLLLALALMIGGIGAIVAAALLLLLNSGGSDEGPLVTTQSGLQYRDLKVGDGPQPNIGDQVTVHYVGKLQDGTIFDDSRAKDTPFTFILGKAKVIPGWDEGISTIRRGGKRRLIIPPDLGYGASGFGDIIPPNATLIFDVELLDVKAATTAPDNPPAVAGDEITTPSGLKYIDIEQGTGVTPATGQRVSVHYTGWLQSDGRKFDSSVDRGQPFEFTLGQGNVIAGWDEGLATEGRRETPANRSAGPRLRHRRRPPGDTT